MSLMRMFLDHYQIHEYFLVRLKNVVWNTSSDYPVFSMLRHVHLRAHDRRARPLRRFCRFEAKEATPHQWSLMLGSK